MAEISGNVGNPLNAHEVAEQSREIARQIEVAVRRLLPRLGLAGTVVVRGHQAELHGGGAPVSVEISLIVEQWAVLPIDMRERKAVEVGRRLVEAHRQAGAGITEARSAITMKWVQRGAIVVAAIAIGGGVFGAYRAGWIGGDQGPAENAGVPTQTEAEATVRRQQACEAGRKNAYNRRPIDQFDTSGWVAELWLAKRGGDDLAATSVLKDLIEDGKVAASVDEALGAIEGGTAEVSAGFEADELPRAKGWQSVIVRFHGAYASAFLVDSSARASFSQLGERLAIDTEAQMAAMYARCAHLRYRDVGAWFRGVDRASAAASLVYSIGAFTESPTIDRTALAAAGGESDLDGLLDAMGKLDGGSLATLVGTPGGNLTSGGSGEPVVLSFPLLGGTAAGVASTSLARKAGVGVGHD